MPHRTSVKNGSRYQGGPQPSCDSPRDIVIKCLSVAPDVFGEIQSKTKPCLSLFVVQLWVIKSKNLPDVKALTTRSIYSTVQRECSHHILPGSAGEEHILSTHKASFLISEKTGCKIIRN